MTVHKLLQAFFDKGTKFYPATNSLKFHSNDETDKNYIWIEPPWRILKGTKVVASSFTCPWHENFKAKEEYSKAFDTWAETMKYLNDLAIKRHTQGHRLNDLIIEWTDGTILEVFQKENDDYAWYITDIESKKSYYGLADRIVINDMK